MKLNLTFFMFIAMLSCKNQEGQLNYSEEKLVEVTQDLYVASETLKKLDDERADSLRNLYNHQIETIHDVELSLYEEDIATLKTDLNKYVAFHKIVRDSLQKKSDRIKKKKPANKKPTKVNN